MALFVRRRWPKVLAAVGVLALVVLVVVLMTRDSSPSPRSGTGDPDVVETGEPVPDATLPAGSLAAVLTASDAELKTYAEQTVVAEGEPVLSVVGPSAAWLGRSAQDRVLLVMVGTAQTFDFPAGTRLSFTGTVKRTSSGFGKALGLTGADNAEFERQGTYVEVEAYRVA
jgi:hypothetical protein